ncbi:MAG: LytTR family DNA-binding domain-containing protein [Megasphaera sp.]|jgi:two-component system LytT family response regulator/two-component system response regulator LytT|nr:LytTR family DNA-binding domain-containing protein [Megasphaera sp.]MCI1247622.1 LytTR family DNA-binding domain-containing protein [Megasphaera sp.]
MKADILIVEDEEAVARELRTMVNHIDPDLHVIGICGDGETALARIISDKPDLVLLDIELPGINGLEVAGTIAKMDDGPAVVFLTAYDQFALEAFDVNAVDYILKPIDERKLRRILERSKRILDVTAKTADKTKETSPLRHMAVDKGDTMEVIDCCQIRFIYGENHYIHIMMTNGESHEVRMSLRDMEERLPQDSFFRCHRSYIVNVNEIKQIKTWFKRGYILVLNGKPPSEIPVGRAYVDVLKSHIEF